jgi:hypothetical protein
MITFRSLTRRFGWPLRRDSFSTIGMGAIAVFAIVLGDRPLAAQENKESKPTTESVRELEQQQKQLARRFGQLEELLIRMSELEAAANPTRAGLLLQAAQMSKQLATLQRLSVAGDLLSQGKFTRAIQEQEAGRENLKKLLELLQSENRSTRLRDERARLEDIQKEIRRLEQIQRGQTARTEAGQDMKQAATDQKDIKEQLEKVDSDLNQGKSDESKSDESKSDPSKTEESQSGEQDKPKNPNDTKPTDKPKGESDNSKEDPSKKDPSKDSPNGESKDSKDKDSLNQESKPTDKPSDQKPSDQKPSDQKPSDQKPSDQKQSDQKKDKADNEKKSGKPSDTKDSKDAKDSDPKEQKGSESEEGSESSDSGKQKEQPKPESREDKAKKRVQSAKKRMEKAQENLEKENREDAVVEQREAERELREAIEELEKILRQLREEEIERSLVDVETRLRKMVDLQRTVREQTEQLGNLTGDLKDRTLEISANKLSIEQTKVVMEGQRALLLLQDEGSSTAFPEALEQVNSDAQIVAKRLTQANVSASTLVIEDEIIGALEEMLDSLKQVQKKREEKKQQQQQQQQQQQGEKEEPLVDSISELKLLKTLQLRVNRRTQSMAKQTDNQEDVVGQIADPNLLGELAELATRQQKIHEVTRDILLKAAKD